MSLKLSVLSPERKLIESALVEEVTLPTSEGQIQILPGHATMIGLLETGVVSYRLPDGVTVSGVISTGTFEVKDDLLTVLAETLELAKEIDVARAQRAQKTAEDALRDAALDEHQFKKYQFKLQRALVRQQIAGKEHG
jgi:F-type H+-transporting ATPase subunit epsilon